MAADFSTAAVPLSRRALQRQRTFALVVSFTAVLLMGARQRAVRYVPDPPPADVFSYAEPQKIVISHASLDLHVDFDERRIRGSARLDLRNISGTGKLVLDTKDLEISSVLRDDGIAPAWTLGEPGSHGTPLTIDIAPTTRSVTVVYETASASSSGLQWNSAAQSFGRKYPYLYTQNEPIDARSWIPIQDTPSVRMTYDATVHVPPGFLAVMSAENPIATNETGVYTFRMNERIPAYLIALAVAHLEFRPLSDRVGVYAEPELISDAAWDLQTVPAIFEAAQRIAGPYPFGRYDMLMMPPTYIVGGMEHPRLNFINPLAVVSGNQPDVPVPPSLIAHELSHAWAGDSATLATWEDVWLNEGITSYLEMRILEEMPQSGRAEFYWWTDRRNFAEYARTVLNRDATLLHRPLTTGDDPNALFTYAAYTKGQLFMRMIEEHVGRDAMDLFLRAYFERFAFRWVDDRHFLAFLRDTLLASHPEVESQMRLDEWVYGTGMPDNVIGAASSQLYNRVAAAADAFRSGTPAAGIDRTNWTDVELGLFLDLANTRVLTRMAEVDAAFGLSARNTPPGSWLRQSVNASYSPGLAAVDRYLMRGGPNNAIVSLYAELAKTDSGKTLARSIYARARERYHAQVQAQVDYLLGWQAAVPPLAIRKAA